MKKIAFIIISAIAASCSNMVDENHYYVTPELKSFVDNFYNEAAKQGIRLQKNNLSITLKKLDFHAGAGVEGVSVYNKDEVFLDVDFATNLLNSKNHIDSLNVEYVVFHELGHYLLHRGHISEQNYTIMTPDGWYKSDFQTSIKKRNQLITELFKVSAK